MSETTIAAIEGGATVTANPATTYLAKGAVAFLGSDDYGWYDREGTVRLIEVLTDAVEAHDVEEARKAAEEAAKLKVGDIVRLKGHTTSTRVVITDEDESGRVDLVNLTDEFTHLIGGIQRRKYADGYVRI